MIISYFLIPITMIMAICAVMIVMRSKVDVPRYSPESEQSDEPKIKIEKEKVDKKCCSCCLRKEKISKEEEDAEEPLTKAIN